MTRPRIKICGLTRAEDAALAVKLGADAVGFVFWPRSPRAVDAHTARQIVETLPPEVARVGVCVNETPVAVAELVRAVGLNVVQLHGDEDVANYRHVGAALIKAVGLDSEDAVARALGLPGDVTVLVDAVDAVRRGGTGRLADWSRAARVARVRPVMLAGGLTADSVGAAMAAVEPWALDVSSGVELAPGIKDHDRLRAFFAAVADQIGAPVGRERGLDL
jgi:phosphoribosylanthranilate isomerase